MGINGKLAQMFKPHIALAHHYWKTKVGPGSRVIDATAGNGYDTLYLAELLQGQGELTSYDIQPTAIHETQKKIAALPPELTKMIHLRLQSHAFFEEKQLDLIVYNLGYLPGGDKKVTTRVETTLQSVGNALDSLNPQGALSITCYPGHEEGEREEKALLDYLEKLHRAQWTICYHKWINRPLSPTLIWLTHEHFP